MPKLLDACGPLDFLFLLSMPDSQTATFSVTPPGEITNPTYEWHKIENGVDTIVGTDSASFTTGELINAQTQKLTYYYKTKFYVIINGIYKSRAATLLVERPTCVIMDTPRGGSDANSDISGSITGDGIWTDWHNIPHDTSGVYDFNSEGIFAHYSLPWARNASRISPAYGGDPYSDVMRLVVTSRRGVGISNLLGCHFVYWADPYHSVPPLLIGGGIAPTEPDHAFTFLTLPPRREYLQGIQPIVLNFKVSISRPFPDPTRVIFDPGCEGALVHRTDNIDGTFSFAVTYPVFYYDTVVTPSVCVEGEGKTYAPSIKFYGYTEVGEPNPGWQIYPSGRNR